MLNKKRISMSAKTRIISAPVDLATLAEAARRGPLTLTADGKRTFVTVSPDEFERVLRRATTCNQAPDSLIAAVRAMQRTAAARRLDGGSAGIVPFCCQYNAILFYSMDVT